MVRTPAGFATAQHRPRFAALPGTLSLVAAALAWAALPTLTAHAQSTGASRSHLANIETQQDPPPVTALGQTYLLLASADHAVSATSWPLVSSVPGTPAPTFVPAVSMPVSIEQSGQPGDGLTVVWTLAVGTLVGDAGQSIPAGALRADVSYTSTDPDHPGCTTIAAISAIPQATAIAIQQSLAEATYLPPPEQTDDTPVSSSSFCLGTTCSCGTCPNGHRFSAPLFIVGRCNQTAAVNCCESACQVMCNAQAGGMSPTDAWIIGQGQFVICVIAHPES